MLLWVGLGDVVMLLGDVVVVVGWVLVMWSCSCAAGELLRGVTHQVHRANYRDEARLLLDASSH